MKINYLLSIILFMTSCNGVKIALTIDDYPLPDSGLFSARDRTEMYVSTLKKYQVSTVFFCVGQHCNDRNDSFLFDEVQKQDHYVANHSMNHSYLSKISIQEFEKEIQDVEDILRNTKTYRKWFRYPYLDYGHIERWGGSKEKIIAGFRTLEKLGYQEGYVTINTFDWFINKRLQEAIKQKRNIDYQKLGNLYITLLKEWILYYIALYKELIGHDMVHTILLHDNDLNALYLPQILAMISHEGWEIVSPEVAFFDTSWRKLLFDKIEQMKKKPETLNCDRIDELLAQELIIQ